MDSVGSVRTSLSHPLRIDEVTAGDSGGLIGIMFCPGKRGPGSWGYRWERDLKLDLDAVAKWQPNAMLTLIEDHEFNMLGVPDLGAQVCARGIEWYHLPIPDVDVPDERFEVAWRSCGAKLIGLLRGGGRVLVHCRGGLGRAGMIAARLLVELGILPTDAIRRVRAARPRAIETHAQAQYVLNLPSRLGAHK